MTDKGFTSEELKLIQSFKVARILEQRLKYDDNIDDLIPYIVSLGDDNK